ncbi:hypothetical protein ASF84_05450 [Pseudomonas sp. Leaf127]|uniref:hypothetical protein n=1 Tax=Pseudomonas sp. Leaf127 TaxID=1736267 RepID=UPI000702B092|nr:hypothetical protein [Pseudomonas sp. Leaf127]KQQ60152.1 hypothetical protein ASF84_05450 [Pseudomonas sp. Leaf127]
MKKDECEAAIRHLAHEWAKTQEQPPGWHPSFSSFERWLNDCGYGHYLEFKGVMSASDIAEQWFDQELKQGWRN